MDPSSLYNRLKTSIRLNDEQATRLTQMIEMRRTAALQTPARVVGRGSALGWRRGSVTVVPVDAPRASLGTRPNAIRLNSSQVEREDDSIV